MLCNIECLDQPGIVNQNKVQKSVDVWHTPKNNMGLFLCTCSAQLFVLFWWSIIKTHDVILLSRRKEEREVLCAFWDTVNRKANLRIFQPECLSTQQMRKINDQIGTRWGNVTFSKMYYWRKNKVFQEKLWKTLWNQTVQIPRISMLQILSYEDRYSLVHGYSN